MVMDSYISLCYDPTHVHYSYSSTRSCQSMSTPSKPSIHPEASTGKAKQNALQSLRPLAPKPLPLLPKLPLSIKTSTSQTTDSSSSSRRSPGPCAVCLRVGCQLPTHSAYYNESGSSGHDSEHSASSVPPVDTAFTSSYAYRLAQQCVDPDITASKVDPVYNLPLGPEMNTPEMHRLYHSWFEANAKNRLLVPRPPGAVSDTGWHSFFLPGLQDPLLCLSILMAAAAIHPHLVGQTEAKNVVVLTLLGQAIQRMRERLSQDSSQVSDTTICAAVLMWTVHMHFEDVNAMESHSASVYAFVESRGGLDKLGFSGAIAQIVRWVDIVHCFIVSVPCHYPAPPNPGPLPKALPLRYGAYWDQPKGKSKIVLDSSLMEVCRDTCRLIEFLEHVSTTDISGSDYVYVMQSISVLFTQCATLRIKTYRDKANKSICFAMALVQYHCFLGTTRGPPVAKINLSELIAAIKATGGLAFWRQELDLLIWLLFIAVTIPAQHDEKSWCRPLLSRAVSTRFGVQGVLSIDWRQALKECLQKFVWSDDRFESSFTDTCVEIERELNDDSDEEDVVDGL